jgi:O2-independent ubiquinone biosynthesis protein UbiV
MTDNATSEAGRITLGPVLFNWPADIWRDFYFRMADEAPVDRVVLGEVVCSKRTPFTAGSLPDVIDRLQSAGKEVVLASPALVANERDRRATQELAEETDHTIEANDVGALTWLAGRRHDIGPFVNVYNEDTLNWLALRGAHRISLTGELDRTAIAALMAEAGPAGVELEVQVFGRLPLAISARCYHARAHSLHKDGCQFVCGRDADGLTVETLDAQPFLAINGTQTLSQGYALLIDEVDDLRRLGVSWFRLSPHSCDMVAVARLFRDRLDGRITPTEARLPAAAWIGAAGRANGFYYGQEGTAAPTQRN